MAKNERRDRIIYWIATVIIAGLMLVSSYNLLASPDMVAALDHLGFPGYFRVELGIAKGLGALVLLIPGLPFLLKFFAYSGFTIALVSAMIAHVAVGDPLSYPLQAAAFLVVLILSYVYLPHQRSKTPLRSDVS